MIYRDLALTLLHTLSRPASSVPFRQVSSARPAALHVATTPTTRFLWASPTPPSDLEAASHRTGTSEVHCMRIRCANQKFPGSNSMTSSSSSFHRLVLLSGHREPPRVLSSTTVITDWQPIDLGQSLIVRIDFIAARLQIAPSAL